MKTESKYRGRIPFSLVPGGSRTFVLASAAIVGLLRTSQHAQAAIVTLTDANSTVLVDPDNTPGHNNGMYSWSVDGTSELNQQWFWYRVGSSGPEASINSLTVGSQTILDTNANGQNDYLLQNYSEPTGKFTVSVSYLLTGGATNSHASDVGETIKIVNTSGAPLQMHFFQYSDFNLGGSPSNDSLNITGGNTARQTDSTSTVSETVVSPKPTFFQAGASTDSPTILGSLTDGSATTLNNNPSEANKDSTWAFQWDTTIATGGSLLISKDKQITPVPEPTSALAIVAVGGVLMSRKRRRDLRPAMVDRVAAA